MRILYIHTGRIEEEKANSLQTFQMCAAFAECGQEVTLAVNSYTLSAVEAEERVRHELGSDKLAFNVATYKGGSLFGKFRSLGAVPAVNRLIVSTPHDILFVRDPVILPLITFQSPSIVFESHNYIVFPDTGPFDLLWRKLVVSRSRKSNMKLFVAISQALADWWAGKGVPAAKICALHDAVDPDLFADGMSKEEAREALSLPAGRPVVTYAGSLYRDRCISGIVRLAESRPDALFVVVGGPEDAKRQYEAEAEQAGCENMIFTGRVPHRMIPVWLSAADVLLMIWSNKVPTIDFCSPLKVFEYMAAERIIVGQAFPTIKEVLTHEQEAYLAEPENHESLARNLSQALDNPRRGMAEAARARVLREHTWVKRCQVITDRVKLGRI